MRIVFHNPCSPSFTYQIRGPNVEYLGVGDHHEEQYDYLGITAPLLEISQILDVNIKEYSSIPVDDEVCQFTISVYGSSLMQASFMTKLPVIYTVAVIAIFAFVALVLMLYDRSIQQRQHIVMQSALKTNALVNSMYPSNVRERVLMQEEERLEKAKLKRKKRKSAFLSLEANALSDADVFKERVSSKSSTSPIADVFHGKMYQGFGCIFLYYYLFC